MKSVLFVLTLIAVCVFQLAAQSTLSLQGEPVELISSADPGLDGIFTNVSIAPYPSQAFSFVLQQDDNRYLYVYDISSKSLDRIIPAIVLDDEELTDEGVFLSYNDQISWRPVLDNQGRQWYAFVSNIAGNNHDIYLGFKGGTDFIRLTADEAMDMHPQWSPDGDAIAFISSRSENSDIYLAKNMNKVLGSRQASRGELVQLTWSEGEEVDLAWNPDAESHLLAFAQRVRFPGRKVETFQIQVIDLKSDGLPVYQVTEDPLRHFTRPSWDPTAANKLMYVGQSILRGLSTNLYVSELGWDDQKQLSNQVLEGYKTEAFRDIRLGSTPALWLSGSHAILAQQDSRQENYPLYTIDIERWLSSEEGAVNSFRPLQLRFPHILDYDVRKNNMVVVTRDAGTDRIFYAQVFGDQISTYERSRFMLRHPDSGGRFGKTAVLAGGAVVAGTAAYFFFRSGGDDESDAGAPIGRPPSHP